MASTVNKKINRGWTSIDDDLLTSLSRSFCVGSTRLVHMNLYFCYLTKFTVSKYLFVSLKKWNIFLRITLMCFLFFNQRKILRSRGRPGQSRTLFAFALKWKELLTNPCFSYEVLLPTMSSSSTNFFTILNVVIVKF